MRRQGLEHWEVQYFPRYWFVIFADHNGWLVRFNGEFWHGL